MAKKSRHVDGRRNPQPWTRQHVQELRAHSRAKTPVAKISKLTRRTVPALRMKASELGLSLGHRR